MTKVKFETLRALVIQGDRSGLCAAVAPLNEAERKSLADEALELFLSIDKSWGPGNGRQGAGTDEEGACPDLIRELRAHSYSDWRIPRWTASLMVAALCGREVIEKSWNLGTSWLRSDLRDMPQRLLQIMTDRRPAWLKSWLEREWRQEDPVPSWFVERGLIRCGALPANNDPAYFARMASDTRILERSDEVRTDKLDVVFRTRKQLLEADPQLLEHDVWRLFEIDSDAFRFSLKVWGKTLVEFGAEGKLDRGKLLLQSLVGMTLPLAPSTLNGMGKFHEMLSPKVEERLTLVKSYLLLLRSNQSTVVGHGLKALDILMKAKKLDAISYFGALPDAFLVDKKAHPVKALGLAGKLLKQNPACSETAFSAIVPALRHANRDVQETAMKLLESLTKTAPANAASQLQEVDEMIATPLRPRFQKLLSSFGSNGAAGNTAAAAKNVQTKKGRNGNTQESVATGQNVNTDSFQQRAASIPESIRANAQVDLVIQSLRQNDKPCIVSIHKRVAPRRDATRTVEPVGSLEELIEIVSANIERVGNVIDLERILDGISRFHAEQPDDFEKRTGALRQRITKQSEQFSSTVLDMASDIGLTQLLISWLQMPPLERTEINHWYTMRGWFLRERIAGVKSRIEESQNEQNSRHSNPMPLLALPTHQGGWLDPVALVDRLNNHYAVHRELPDNYDLAQAILRLTPDGRDEALAKLGKPDHYNGNKPLRYALGDNCELSSTGGWGDESLLAAAARARALFDETTPAALPLARAWFGEREVVHVSGPWMADPTVPFSLAEVAFSNQPTSLRALDPHDRQHWIDTWEAITNPMDSEPGCMAGHMTLLLDSESTWGYEASRLAVVASACDRSESRILAADAIIDAIARALVVPEILGKALANCMEQIKLNRACKALGEVAQVSPLHHWVILRSLESCVLNLPELPNDIQLILNQMLECAMSIGACLEEPATEKLQAITGKSKAGKLASQLLGLKESSKFRTSVNEALARATLDRAERWSSTIGTGNSPE